MNELEAITDHFKNFIDGVRVVMLIDRGVMNSNKGSKRWINKIITTNEAEWINAVERLSALQDHLANPDVRMYSCVNSRKLDKGIKLFQHMQLDVQPDMINKFYSKINNTFCGALMKPENKLSKYFLLDIDSKTDNEIDEFMLKYDIQFKFNYPTPNGWHYIVEPFNAIWANGYKTFTLIKDGLLLIRTIGDNNGTKIRERCDGTRVNA